MPVAYIQNSLQPVLLDGNEVCLEEGRIDSFDTTWPHADDSSCSKERMAKAGFFYNGYADEVKCFVCLVKLVNWIPETDDPWEKHKELTKKCSFATLGKEESSLTVEEFTDIVCSRTINILDDKFDKLLKE